MEDVSTSHTCLTLSVTVRLSRSVDLKFPLLAVRTSVNNQRGKTSILILVNHRTINAINSVFNQLFFPLILDISQCVDLYTECRFVQDHCDIDYFRHVCPRTCNFCHHPGEFQDVYFDGLSFANHGNTKTSQVHSKKVYLLRQMCSMASCF